MVVLPKLDGLVPAFDRFLMKLGFVQSMYWSEVIGIAWAVHQIGACAVHMLSKSRLRVFIVV